MAGNSDVVCVRPGRSLAQMWPKRGVKETLQRPILLGHECLEIDLPQLSVDLKLHKAKDLVSVTVN